MRNLYNLLNKSWFLNKNFFINLIKTQKKKNKLKNNM